MDAQPFVKIIILLGRRIDSIKRNICLKYLSIQRERNINFASNKLNSEASRITANNNALIYEKAILQIDRTKQPLG